MPWPFGADCVTAGGWPAAAAPAAPPDGATDTAKAGPEVGGGVHRKAQPMFQVPPAMVKTRLVQVVAVD